MPPFTPALLPPDLAPLISTPKSLSTGGYHHFLDDDLALRSPPYLDTIISPYCGTLPPPTSTTTPGGTLGPFLGLLPTELLLPILSQLDIRTLLHFRTLNRHALSLVDLCPGYLSIRQHAPNVLRGILAIEVGKYWTLPKLWEKLCQKSCDSPKDACGSKGGSFAGYLSLLKGKRYCWSCWWNNLRSPSALFSIGGGDGWREGYHGWPGPLTVDFAAGYFGLDPNMLERVEPMIRALPRAVVHDVVRMDLGLIRGLKGGYKYGSESGTWAGMGGLGEGDRLVFLDTETVFALAVYLGFEPGREMKSCWSLSTQLRHCWRRYMYGNEEAFLAKGREAARKAGVDLEKVTPPEPESLRWRRNARKANGKRLDWIDPPAFRPWWRYFTVVRAPWFDTNKMEVQWGFLCSTCGKPTMRPRNSTPDAEFWEFTVESFKSHLEKRGGVVNGNHCHDALGPSPPHRPS